jgi:hypothetical protein
VLYCCHNTCASATRDAAAGVSVQAATNGPGDDALLSAAAIGEHSNVRQPQREGWMAGEPALVVAPLAGRLLLFDSGLDHEVLPSHSHRCAR